MKTFFVCALEPSANLHLKEILKIYRQEYGKFELCGIFDEALCEEFKLKNKPLYSSHEFSAMGFVEIIPLIFKAKRAIKELTQMLLKSEMHLVQEKQESSNAKNSQELTNSFATSQSPKTTQEIKESQKSKESQTSTILQTSINAVLCIDSPAFNIPLAKALKKAGSKVTRIYYILPQVWAWKKGRIPVIESHFDILASILPFDEKFFTKSVYVGHPLLDEIKEFKDKKKSKKPSPFCPAPERVKLHV